MVWGFGELRKIHRVPGKIWTGLLCTVNTGLPSAASHAKVRTCFGGLY